MHTRSFTQMPRPVRAHSNDRAPPRHRLRPALGRHNPCSSQNSPRSGLDTERRTKAIALYIGAAAKWARIKFHVTHVPGSAMFGVEAAAESIDGFRQPPVDFAPIYALTQFNAARYKTQKPCFLPNYPPTAKLISHAV
jgi:hypothetical protein